MQPDTITEVYELVKAVSKEYPTKTICDVVGVSRSSYYAYSKGESHRESKEDLQTRKKVRDIFTEHKRRYGVRRIQAELRNRGEKVGLHRVRKLMKAEGLRSIQAKSYVPKTTQSPRELAACENLLKQETAIEKPNQAWVGDITYIPLSGGKFAYLSSWQDVYTRVIKGWSLLESMPEDLIISAFERAVEQYNPPAGLIVHSDRGGQYFSKNFRKKLSAKKCRQSMAGVEDPYENAMAESLWSRLKAELLEDGVFETIEDARVEIFTYIEGYYNTQRLHSGIGYKKPAEFERDFYQSK